MAISGDTVVVGVPAEDSLGTTGDDNGAGNAGAVYVFVRSGTLWGRQAFLKASNPSASDSFGISVALDADTLVVGALYEDGGSSGVNGANSDDLSNSGAAYVFVRSGTGWTQQAYLKASNPGERDYFGYSVAVSGDTAVVGAYQDDSGATGVNGSQSDNSASDSGAAYVFARHGTTWGQEAYLKASNTGADDSFGFSVAVSGDTVLVGAHNEDSSATGVNGNQADNGAGGSGAVYLFTRIGPNWRQQSYLKATNTGDDSFGVSVAISGDTVVIGAHRESSSATGVNGNQADNSMYAAGAAYVFTITGMDTATTLASDRNPATLGDLIALTATVTPTEATDTVTFKDGATTLGTGALASGSAVYSTTALTGGSHGLTAVYAGDTTYSGSTSATLTQAVKNPSSIAVVSGLNPADLGQSVSLTASVTPAAATGTLTFMDGATALGTATLSAGSASFSTAALAAGSHAITVVYGGDGIYNGSTSPALTQTVQTPAGITIATEPAGLTITVDGTQYSAPHAFAWTPGTSHSIAVDSPQGGAGGGHYAFASWSDGGALAHAITAPAAGATYTAAFQPVVTTLGAAVTAKAGTLGGARTWTITLTNTGGVPASAARLTGLNLGVVGTCRPVVTSALPLDLGDIPVGASVAANVAVTFSGCGRLVRFNGSIGYSADGGAVAGATSLLGVSQ